MERIISLIGKQDRKVDWAEMYMERKIGSLCKLGRKVDIGRKMNDPDGALDPWSCLDERLRSHCSHEKLLMS